MARLKALVYRSCQRTHSASEPQSASDAAVVRLRDEVTCTAIPCASARVLERKCRTALQLCEPAVDPFVRPTRSSYFSSTSQPIEPNLSAYFLTQPSFQLKNACNMDTSRIGRSLVQSVGCRNETLYSALPESGVIRLVNIRAGDWDEDIVCDIFETSLGTMLPYKALSYAWRSDQNEPDATISCNGVDVEISANIFHALRQLRNFIVPVVIWVDFLCINQQDVVERSLQVTMMKEIYEKSREVIIWLGEGSKNDQFEERGRGSQQAQLTKRAPIIEWYDDERDLTKTDPYSEALEDPSMFSSTSAKAVYGAFFTIYLLSQGVAPANIYFLKDLVRARDVVPGIRALMSQSWVRSISLNFHAPYS